ncbi:MAG: Fe-S protein assembly co-chaperone HscB [Candidatus Tectomicrobia bacterium]|uniref:Fe-S protein assembly co-chaperone HscB n=1 Tax=Tectimicrobiota bacterium TaxID=2528274 RepID=A0A932ZTX1_UNCTE|nr:Fe-S protein assembly co-chaperone HscB [Candidatus Tectomicrobia bacterium]
MGERMGQPVMERREFALFGEGGGIRRIPPEVSHFGLFGLPPKVSLDERALEAKYYALSRRLHPDFFMAAPVGERIRSLEASARLNEAYKTLKSPVRRAVYLVELASGRLAENDARPPAGLLEQILEAQEAAAELRCGCGGEEAGELRGRIGAARECFEALRSGQRKALEDLGAQWDRAVDEGRPVPPEALQKMRSILSQRNYIENILRSLREALEAAP